MTQYSSIPAHEVVSHVRTVPAVRHIEPEGLLARLRRSGRSALRTVAQIRTERATARALAELNEHQLRDIGVDRGAIPRVARAAAWAHLTTAGLDHPGGSPFDRGYRGL